MKFTYIFSLFFALYAILYLTGKGDRLIPIYCWITNEEKRRKVNIHRLRKLAAAFSILSSILFVSMSSIPPHDYRMAFAVFFLFILTSLLFVLFAIVVTVLARKK